MKSSYRTELSPWAIYSLDHCISPTCIRRFRKRGDAEEHLRLLRRQGINFRMEIVFDLPSCASDRVIG